MVKWICCLMLTGVMGLFGSVLKDLPEVAAGPFSCDLSPSLGCFVDVSDTTRALTHLILPLSTSITLEDCLIYCHLANYSMAGVTGNDDPPPQAACYCGNGINPQAQQVFILVCSIPYVKSACRSYNGCFFSPCCTLLSQAPASDCNVTCPGNHSQNCGGVLRMNVYQGTCSGLPPRPPPSPPLPSGPACSQAAVKGMPFCDTTLTIDERVIDLVQLFAQLKPAILLCLSRLVY
jgi:hypothetical protein